VRTRSRSAGLPPCKQRKQLKAHMPARTEFACNLWLCFRTRLTSPYRPVRLYLRLLCSTQRLSALHRLERRPATRLSRELAGLRQLSLAINVAAANKVIEPSRCGVLELQAARGKLGAPKCDEDPDFWVRRLSRKGRFLQIRLACLGFRWRVQNGTRGTNVRVHVWAWVRLL
jgi:hypothetical protein